MSLKPYNGSFDALTGSIFASWFELSTKGPMAHAVGYAETSDRPWSLFYRWMRPAGNKAYLGAAVKEELSAASEDFGGVFFNFMIGLNNHLVGTDEQFLSEAPVFIRTNGNPQVDAAMRWLVENSPNLLDLDWGRERYLRQTYGANLFGSVAEKFDRAYEPYMGQQGRSSSEALFAHWWDLVTGTGYVEPCTLQFAQSWVSAARGSVQERSSVSYSTLSEFFDGFHLPLLPPELNG
jgi:hypothetical protein